MPSNVKSRLAPPPLAINEAEVWRAVGAGWQHLHGSFQHRGFSFEWHDFQSATEFDWARSFHPGSVEVCLNLSGEGRVNLAGNQADYTAGTVGFYRQGREPLTARRAGTAQHQFITVEFSSGFLREHLASQIGGLHPLVAAVVTGDEGSGVGVPARLTAAQHQLILSLRHPPVFAAAQTVWYLSKALEVAAGLFYQPPPEQELFCDRQKRAARDRVERVVAILKRDLANPPALEQLGREVGCSPFYLSRTFSRELGLTIPQYVRQLRMERAADLLRSGRFNVTEAALEVGYASLSHFSVAFHQTFGCCPGLYPHATPTQKVARG